MLLQSNSYMVPKDKRAEHARLIRKFRQTLARIGCDQFDVFEQVGPNWSGETTGRFIQMMRFRDRKQQLAVQNAEKQDPGAQALIAEFCELINFPYQQQQGLFAVGFYQSVLPVAPVRSTIADAVEPVDADPQPETGGLRAVEEEVVEADEVDEETPLHAEPEGSSPAHETLDVQPAEAQPMSEDDIEIELTDIGEIDRSVAEAAAEKEPPR